MAKQTAGIPSVLVKRGMANYWHTYAGVHILRNGSGIAERLARERKGE